MIINLSNHPSDKWDEKQRDAAKQQYGEIKDLPFPKISSQMNTEDVHSLADKYFDECELLLKSFNKSECAIHLAGEPTFCYYLTNKLVSTGYKVVSATTERIVDMKDNIKTSVFNFSQFRELKKSFPRVPSKTKEKLYCRESFLYFMLILSFVVEKIVLDAVNIIFYEHSGSFCGYCRYIFSNISNNPSTYWRFFCLVILVSYIICFLIGWYYRIYQANTSTMRKFLNYTIGFRLISVCIVISFLCQITWFIDVAFPLFFGSFDNGVLSYQNSIYSITQLVVIGIFMYLTFALFHVFTWMAKKRIIQKEERTLLVSGFSYLKPNGLDLFAKPFSDYNNIKTVIVLLSNTTFSTEFDYDNKETKSFVESYMPFIEDVQLLKDYNSAIIAFKEKSHDEGPTREEYRFKMQGLFRSIIKSSIDRANPLYRNKTIDIHFTEDVNYNKFDDIYKALSKPLKIEENNNDKGTLINISPGTSMVSGALTAFAIKGNRQLIYCVQGENSMEESVVNVWTLNDILKELWSEIEEGSES